MSFQSFRSKTATVPTPALIAGGSILAAGLSYLGYAFYKRSKFMDPLFKRESKEEKLLKYVVANAKEGDAESVINTIDQFCNAGNWMMNVGDKKGLILDEELRKKQPQVVLELGAYCGYSALRIGRLLPKNGHLYSIEIDALNAAIATKIIEFAGLKDRVTFIIGTVETKVKALQTQYGLKKLDLVFLDHLKSVYKSDLIILEKSGLIQTGTVLVADNCLFPGCPDYVEYVSTHPDYVSVRHETELEYVNDVKDHVWVSTRK